MLMVLVVTSYLRIRRKCRKWTTENEPHRIKEIRRNPATIAFFSYVIADSIGFRRVDLLAIGLVRKGAVDGRRLRIFWIFFLIYSPYVADSPFQTYRTHTEK